jgi:hypothetical protein
MDATVERCVRVSVSDRDYLVRLSEDLNLTLKKTLAGVIRDHRVASKLVAMRSQAAHAVSVPVVQ